MKRIMLYLPLFLLCYNHDIHAEAFNGKELEISTDDVSGFSVSKAEIVYPDISNFYPVPGTAYTIQNAILRDSPSQKSNSKGSINAGTEVQILDYDGDWAKLENGYVYAGLLSEVYTYPSQIHGEDLESLKYAGYLYSDLQNLPSKIQALAETTPITLVASQEQLSKEVKDVLPAGVSGYTTHYTGTSQSEIRIWANTDTLQSEALHELGHVFDFSNEVIAGTANSEDEAWQQIYQQEKEKYRRNFTVSEHNISNESEYFADAVKCYISENAKLKNSVPETYSYLQACID